MPRYLTKSRFKLAVECPTKLFYTGKKSYKDSMEENEFLAMLAEGGYQVGALAQLAFPDGLEIKSKAPEAAAVETTDLLQQDNITLFEPAIRVGSFLVRIDVLIKTGNHFHLIEVKAKSYSSEDPKIEGRNKIIGSSMLPYIQDIAFQTWVLRQAYPGAEISSSLMMPDKAKSSPLDSVNQMFKINRVQRNIEIERCLPVDIDPLALSKQLLSIVPVDEYVSKVLNEPLRYPGGEGYLSDLALEWARAYEEDSKVPPKIGSHCGSCQFQAGADSELKSGFLECWSQATNLNGSDLTEGTVLDLWNYRGKQQLIDRKIYRISEVGRDDLGDFPEDVPSDGLSRAHRQWLQVNGIPDEHSHSGFYLDEKLIKSEMSKWKYPLHLIDFETSSVALPFYKDMHPYEPIAFQFSHHQMQTDGTVFHAGEYLNGEPGSFPNYDFVRALKGQLDADDGSVFMWSNHENTILSAIKRQLQNTKVPPIDGEELIAFLDSLTKGGNREMIDLCKLAEKAFFHPDTKGSNSIKKVLPAVLKISKTLQSIYSSSIYGALGGVKSLNFASAEGIAWISDSEKNPYSKLKNIAIELLPEDASSESVIAEGGAAATAYARLQFETLNGEERQRIKSALLRYCELDTLAMVMVVQAWQDLSE